MTQAVYFIYWLLNTNHGVNYETNEQHSLTISPNPAFGYIFVTAEVGEGEYELYNVLGAKVGSGVLSATGRTRVDVSGLTPGIYTIRANNTAIQQSKTIIIQQK